MNTVLKIELDETNAGAVESAVSVTAGSSTIRGLVINNFNGFSILLKSAGGNVIEGNFLGTDISGTSARPNRMGVVVEDTANDYIGGTLAGARNLLSGTDEDGVQISGSGATGNNVQGNLIGTDAAGTSALGNVNDGISLNSPNNTIGGTSSGARNVISGNGSYGIRLRGTGNQVQGNYIGTNVTGTASLGNFIGIAIFAANNTVGGTVDTARNVISGNVNEGVRLGGTIDLATGNFVQGNYIGTDATGLVAVSNFRGIWIQTNGSSNIIGGTTSGARNIISGNAHNGVQIGPGTVTNNLVQGNFIGTDVNGDLALGNNLAGVSIAGAANNTIGGTAAGAGNTIAFNGGDGVFVETGTGNTVLGNSIFSNTGLGIDLGADGVTANDAGDGDTGPNNLQNFPLVTFATSGSIIIQGTLNSAASTQFRLEFFSNTSCDPSGNGEGKTFRAPRYAA